MPIYEYQCKACGNVFEMIRSINDEGPAPCKSCGVEDTKRLISQSSFVLKGSGWYKTDYAGGGAGEKKTEVSDKSESKPESSPPTEKESKPAPAKSGDSAD